MLYKIVKDGTVIDVAVSPLQCCKYGERSKLVLRCGENESPNGYISERTGYYYQVSGWPAFPDGTDSAGSVELIEIDQNEYDELLDALDAGDEIIDPDDPTPEPDTPGKTRVQQLEEQVAALQEANDMLTECILEMSEIIYGE